MGRTRRLPSIDVLRRLRRDDLTLEEIGAAYGVSESAVFKALDRAGDVERLPTYQDILPWSIAPEHKKSAVMDHFRTLAALKGGKTTSASRRAGAQEWLDGMNAAAVVVSYHKDAPPNAASPRTGGFFYVPREDRDTWVIRMPEAAS